MRASGSKAVAAAIPVSAFTPSHPPTTSVRPSARLTWPAQKRLPTLYGTGTKVPVDGFQRFSERGEFPQMSHIRTLPVGVRIVSTATTGKLSTGDHSPIWGAGELEDGTTSIAASSGSSAEP